MQISNIRLSVKNFRSFHTQAEIDIRPITVFIGRNSSGKSSITRLVPLLQQTFEARTSTPILWFGKSVDFGSAREVMPRAQAHDMLEINLTMDVDQFPITPPRNYQYYEADIFNQTLVNVKIGYGAYLREQAERTILAGFDINIDDDNIKARSNPDGYVDSLTINNKDLSGRADSERIRLSKTNFFGRLLGIQRELPAQRRLEALKYAKVRQIEILRSMAHGRTQDDTLSNMADALSYNRKKEFSRLVKRLQDSDYYRQSVTNTLIYNSSTIEELRQVTLLRSLHSITSTIEAIMQQIFLTSAYIGPARASGLRFYRWQELALDRLDPEGQNFAMYLMSLSDAELNSFASYVALALSYDVKPDRGKGYASIMVREKATQEWFNLADVGYGLSQILPVVAQLHAVIHRTNRNIPYGLVPRNRHVPRLLAIEQPELHLHPALQARVADLFAAATKRSVGAIGISRDVNIIVETHSEALVNRLADLVEQGEIDEDDVAIYIFHKTENDGTVVKRMHIHNTGEISNWPVGFFLAK